MIKRFQIEDIIVQDAAGVTFRAVDTVTDAAVAVRRFFPFGVDGGGLQEEEEVAYNIAVGRLAGVKHPSLRAVITGGCDPIDSIPYIATEWIEGDLLSGIVDAGPLSAEDAVELVSKALEVCELLSQVLAEEAIWVETELHTIVVANPSNGRGATFWISPLKWLGGIQARGYDTIVTMVEDAMGWKGRIVGDQAGRGLGGWIKWLRSVPATTPLREVRESLAAAVGVDPPVAVAESSGSGLVAKAPTVRAATRQAPPSIGQIPPVKPKGKGLLFIISGLALAIAGTLTWWLTRDPSNTQEPGPVKPMTEVERVNRRALELSQRAASANSPKSPPPAEPVAGVIPWDQRDVLIGHDKRVVTVTGPVAQTAKSSSGKTLYLLFSNDPKSARVGVRINDDNRGAAGKHFESLVGKTIEAKGTVTFNGSIGNHPEIIINSPDDVKSVD